jgi:phytoene synthase
VLLFGAAWEESFDDIIGRGQVMRDPSLLVTRPSATDQATAPAGRDLLSVLAPVPNLERRRIDWQRAGTGYADDEFDPCREPAERARQLDALAVRFRDRDADADAVLPAILDTADRYRIPAALFDAFLASMRMDLTVSDYPDRAALDTYIHGSAEVIGLQLLPVSGATCADEAAPHAAALGKAFQLTNFLRDVAEDLMRGRVYLPTDELTAFGVDRDLLRWCLTRRRTEPRVREALAAQHAITRDIYRFAHAGIALLHPCSRPCVTTATTL